MCGPLGKVCYVEYIRHLLLVELVHFYMLMAQLCLERNAYVV